MIRQPQNLQLCHTALRFVPERLQLARELRQLTRAELGERLGLSASTLATYEQGGAKPEASMLARLCLLLAVPIAFFAREGRPPIAVESCHFRHVRPAQHAARRAQLALTNLLTDVLEFARTHLVLPSDGSPPQQLGLSAPSASVEAMALGVRRRWGLGLEPIVDLTRVCELNGLVVHPIDRAHSHIQPFSLWHRGWPIIFFSPRPRARQQMRIDKAHELGHLVMHADVRPGHLGAEREAEAFARALLLPAPAFMSECPRTLDWEHWYQLERRWRVSIPVLLQRGYELGRLAEPMYRRALAVWKAGGAPELNEGTGEWEEPLLVRRAFELIADEWPVAAVARELGVAPANLATVAALRAVAS